jgi:predicted phage terminase large subunit-like protein
MEEWAWRESVRLKRPLAEQNALEARWLDTRGGADSVLDFVTRASPRFHRPDHLRAIAALFPRTEYERVRALISAPPRHSKTETLSHGIVWVLRRNPAMTIGYVSFEATTAEEKSRNMRDIAQRAGIELRKDSHSVSTWRTPQGGGVIAVGIDGPLTGRGVNLLVVDDPYRGRDAAESIVKRAHVNDWLSGTAMSRVEPGGSVIISHARWHVADIIGELSEIEPRRWEYINLPAINPDGSVLWERRWPLDELMLRKQDVTEKQGEQDWESLYMGRPRIRGEEMFNEPTRYEKPDLYGSRILIACDPATGVGDNSAIVIMAGKRGDDNEIHVDILHVRAARMDIPDLVDELVSLQRKWQCPIFIEAVGGFKGVSQMLTRIGPELRVTDVPAIRSKYVRAQPVAGAWSAGRVRVPAPNAATFGEWVGPFVSECRRFSGAKTDRDDRVDALAHGYNELVTTLRQRPREQVASRIAASLPFGA